MWYAVMRKSERGIFIGTLVIRHSPHHALLLESGWEEIPVAEIGVAGPATLVDEDRGSDRHFVVELLTSSTSMRMQPCEAFDPIELRASVPCMPTPS